MHERLEPAAVAAALGRLLDGRSTVLAVRRLPLPDPAADRGHCSARYGVELLDGPAGEARSEEIFVQGAGIGYFGEHAIAVERALRGAVPDLIGVADGLQYRRWLPEAGREAAPGRRPDAGAIAAHVALRRRRLPARADATPRLAGTTRSGRWRPTSSPAPSGERGGPSGSPPSTPSCASCSSRSAPRSSTAAPRRRTGSARATAARSSRSSADERAFSNRNLACYDAAYDVAGASAGPHAADPEALRAGFAAAAGEWIDDERWLIYQLVAHWAAGRDGMIETGEVERAGARAMGAYFAAALPRGPPARRRRASLRARPRRRPGDGDARVPEPVSGERPRPAGPAGARVPPAARHRALARRGRRALSRLRAGRRRARSTAPASTTPSRNRSESLAGDRAAGGGWNGSETCCEASTACT